MRPTANSPKTDSKSAEGNLVGVRPPSRHHFKINNLGTALPRFGPDRAPILCGLPALSTPPERLQIRSSGKPTYRRIRRAQEELSPLQLPNLWGRDSLTASASARALGSGSLSGTDGVSPNENCEHASHIRANSVRPRKGSKNFTWTSEEEFAGS
jgi:hypothetical protein